jgi:uncharacterized membrane protein
MDQAARDCSISKIVGLVSAQTETAFMLRDKMYETVEEILERVDLPSPITVDYDIVGTGAETYNLLTSFSRLTRDTGAVYEKTRNRRPCTPVTSNGAWTHIKQFGSSGAERFYRITGDVEAGYQISFYRPLGVNETVTVSFVSRNWLRSAAGTLKSSWTAGDDALLLPVPLLRLGLIWRVKSKVGMAYSDVQTEYEIRLSRAVNDLRSIRMVDIGERDVRDGPIRAVAPDFITVS